MSDAGAPAIPSALRPALALRGITKQFGQAHALDAADFIVRPGTVHALLGENGAGKTTLMRIAFGLLAPDGGVIERDGRALRLRAPGDAIAAGIGMVQQHFSLVPNLTVAENVALGGRGSFVPGAALDRVRQMGVETGIVVDGNARVADLSVAVQQRVEILKAFARAATVLILDEPTALLAPSDARDLFVLLRQFADRGHAVVVITHKLREAVGIADDVTVLRRGRSVFAAAARDAREPDLLHAMLDTRIVPLAPLRTSSPGAIVFEAEHVSMRDASGVTVVRDASFAIRAREIIGIAGVEGSGHHELLQVLAGRAAPTSGRIVTPAPVGFVPADRHRDALSLEFSLVENTALTGLGARRGLMPWSEVAEEAQRIVDEFDVVSPDIFAPTSTLSGGNQQRFVLGRELRANPHAIVCENPVRGLDVLGAAAIYAKLRTASDAGAAVVIYSGDVDELQAIADRIFVCFRGTVRETARNTEAIARALVGADE